MVGGKCTLFSNFYVGDHCTVVLIPPWSSISRLIGNIQRRQSRQGCKRDVACRERVTSDESSSRLQPTSVNWDTVAYRVDLKSRNITWRRKKTHAKIDWKTGLLSAAEFGSNYRRCGNHTRILRVLDAPHIAAMCITCADTTETAGRVAFDALWFCNETKQPRLSFFSVLLHSTQVT